MARKNSVKHRKAHCDMLREREQAIKKKQQVKRQRKEVVRASKTDGMDVDGKPKKKVKPKGWRTIKLSKKQKRRLEKKQEAKPGRAATGPRINEGEARPRRKSKHNLAPVPVAGGAAAAATMDEEGDNMESDDEYEDDSE